MKGTAMGAWLVIPFRYIEFSYTVRLMISILPICRFDRFIV